MARKPMRGYVRYSLRIAANICRRIADGESLNKICGPNRRKGMPERLSVYHWLGRNPNFKKAYLLAKQAGAEYLLDQVVDIADGVDEGAALPRDLKRDQLRIATRKWMAELMAPQLVGDRRNAPNSGYRGDDDPDRVETEATTAAKVEALLDAVRRRTEKSGG